jgi:hypothetical protein
VNTSLEATLLAPFPDVSGIEQTVKSFRAKFVLFHLDAQVLRLSPERETST